MGNIISNVFNKNEGILVYTDNSKFVGSSSYKVLVLRQEIRQVASFLKLHSLTRVLSAIDISVVDRINNKLRFNITYHLQSITTNSRYSLITWVSESDALLSLQVIYPAFNWTEREVWDMYGIFISKHPDLRRILTDYGFEGYPLRKDFPLTGFKEVQYEDSVKQIEYTSTELTQSYRLLSHSSNWNG